MKYFDLQVNGYGSVDFNRNDLTAEELRRACEKRGEDCVEGVLATIITEKLDVMAAHQAPLQAARDRRADSARDCGHSY
jgi:N-acetylglucosamine-6-phosphate deacetylase